MQSPISLSLSLSLYYLGEIILSTVQYNVMYERYNTIEQLVLVGLLAVLLAK